MAAMRSRPWGTAVLVLLASVVFGVLFALVKGTGGGWHLVFGNLSAPWLVIPVAAGALASDRAVRAGALGGVAALLSLAAFYATTSIVWHMVISHTARNNTTFLIGGSIGAALVTSVSSRFAARGKAVLLGVLLVCEPAAQYARDHASFTAVSGAKAVYSVEVLIGLLVALFAIMGSFGLRSRDRRPVGRG